VQQRNEIQTTRMLTLLALLFLDVLAMDVIFHTLWWTFKKEKGNFQKHLFGLFDLILVFQTDEY
jgi:hypothetical protein